MVELWPFHVLGMVLLWPFIPCALNGGVVTIYCMCSQWWSCDHLFHVHWMLELWPFIPCALNGGVVTIYCMCSEWWSCDHLFPVFQWFTQCSVKDAIEHHSQGSATSVRTASSTTCAKTASGVVVPLAIITQTTRWKSTPAMWVILLWSVSRCVTVSHNTLLIFVWFLWMLWEMLYHCTWYKKSFN